VPFGKYCLSRPLGGLLAGPLGGPTSHRSELGTVLSAPTVPFFVQFKCKLGQSYAVANALAEAEIASEIYSTAGDYDLLVKFYVDNDTDIGHFVNEKVQVIPGIQDTHTIITFEAFGTG
jgi:DNA-binding Lrp family transcriptional regulator